MQVSIPVILLSTGKQGRMVYITRRGVVVLHIDGGVDHVTLLEIMPVG